MSQAPTKPDFKHQVSIALANQQMRRAVDRGTRRQDGGRRRMMQEFDDSTAVRKLAEQIKNHTLQNLDRYLEQLIDNVEKLGGHVHFAETTEQANAIIADVAARTGSRLIEKESR